jgi:hypothetical protein
LLDSILNKETKSNQSYDDSQPISNNENGIDEEEFNLYKNFYEENINKQEEEYNQDDSDIIEQDDEALYGYIFSDIEPSSFTKRKRASDDASYQDSGNSDISSIYRTEGGITGQYSKLGGTALGRGQMIESTRHGMYKKMGIPESKYKFADNEYATNPEFENQVNEVLRKDLDSKIPSNIQGIERKKKIAIGWYTGNVNHPENVIPHPEAGNKLTAGQYANRVLGFK